MGLVALIAPHCSLVFELPSANAYEVMPDGSVSDESKLDGSAPQKTISTATNIITVGAQLEPPNLDPTMGAAAAIDEVVYANVFEGLTGINADGRVVARLAERWEISNDGRRYRFYLRDNVTFHDGTKFDAEDVKFSLERAGAEGSSNAQKSLFEPISDIQIISPYVIDVFLIRPVGLFLTHMAWGDAVIVAPESAANNSFAPIGTGPFKFERWRKGVGVDLVRNVYYWGGVPEEVGVIDGIRFRFIPDPTAAFAALLAGDVDGFPNYPAPENLEQFRRQEQFDVVEGTGEGETILAINNQVPPFDNLDVRRALNYAVDKQALIDGALFGYGTPIGSHFSPHHPSYIDLSSRYPHDIEKAKELLAKAGYPAGFEATLKLPPPNYARRAGEQLAAQFAQAGIRLKIENIEWAQWLSQIFQNKEYELTIVAHTEPLDIDIYARDDYYFNYHDTEFKKLILDLSQTNDAILRDQLYKQAQNKLAEDAVNVFLFQGPKTAVWAKGINGVWRNGPVQANDLTMVTRTGFSTHTKKAHGRAIVPLILMWVCIIASIFGVGWLALQAGFSFICRKLLSVMITMLIASLVIFILVEIAPGDPALYMMGLNAEPEALNALRDELDLNASPIKRYFGWLGAIVQGDFGVSYTYRTPVSSLIGERLQVSLPLALYSIFIVIILAIPAGTYAASRHRDGVDKTILGISQIGIALPNFWIAILLVLIFASHFGWFPVGGFPGWEQGFFPGIYALTLPALALAIPQAAILTRIVRTSLLSVLDEDYIRTARAKGLSESEVLRGHAIRNAAIPVLTILGLQFSFLMAGAIIIESVFYLPGLGRLVFQAILQRDLIIVESVVFVLVFITVMVAFIVELAFSAVDPRIGKGRH